MVVNRRTQVKQWLQATEWPYWVAGVFLAAGNTLILILLDHPWGITGPITNIGARGLQLLGASPERWAYFQVSDFGAALARFDLWNSMLWLNLGIMAGVAFSAWLSGELRLRQSKRKGRTALLALAGGFLMGYGTRLTAGCNAGTLLGAVPSFSLHGWVFLLAAFAGVLAGLRLFRHTF